MGRSKLKFSPFFFFKGSVEALGMQKVLPGSASVLIPSHFDRETWRSLKALPPEQSSCLILCRKPTVNLCSPTRVKLQYRPEGVNVENVEDGRRFLLHADSLQLWQQHDESLRKGRLSKLTCKFFFLLSRHLLLCLHRGRFWGSLMTFTGFTVGVNSGHQTWFRRNKKLEQWLKIGTQSLVCTLANSYLYWTVYSAVQIWFLQLSKWYSIYRSVY